MGKVVKDQVILLKYEVKAGRIDLLVNNKQIPTSGKFPTS